MTDDQEPTTGPRRLRVAVLLKTNDGGRWILPQITELRGRGHRVVVVLPPGAGRLTTELGARGVEVVESPFDFRLRPTIGTLRGLWRLRGLIRRLRPDVLNYHLYASALAARISTVGLPLRRVHMVAGPLYLESPVIRPVERHLWRLDHVTICGTDYTARLYGELGCPPARRPVATCGVDTDHFHPARPLTSASANPQAVGTGTDPQPVGIGTDPQPVGIGTDPQPVGIGIGQAAGAGPHPPRPTAPRSVPVPRTFRASELKAKARAELGIPQDAFVVIMVAYVYPPKRLAYQGQGIKGHDVLLTAWRSFRARRPRAHLLLVGGGWTPAGVTHRQELIRRFAVPTNPSVTWVESVGDVRPCYQAADLSVSPSLSEGHGAAVEAGAMGVPSIVSDAGGLPETVDDTCGWVVPRGDATALDLTLDAAYREFEAGTLATRGDRARHRMVSLFDNRVAAQRVADTIEHIAGEAVRR
ncbi:hypothetical protein GCM10027290_14750 [Micromonospora sonneratiae]|uniref:Glycosyltransferase n=1 Tax=Micromonospora sonneratiae TaxID=1184706 RepID=A0ABW3YEM8_9ACTN